MRGIADRSKWVLAFYTSVSARVRIFDGLLSGTKRQYHLRPWDAFEIRNYGLGEERAVLGSKSESTFFTCMRMDINGNMVKGLSPYITENLIPTRKMKFAHQKCNGEGDKVVKFIFFFWLPLDLWLVKPETARRRLTVSGSLVRDQAVTKKKLNLTTNSFMA